MNAIEKGYRAVANELRKVFPDVEYDLTPIAQRCIDVWLRTTNPIGARPSETIYDEFYRLRTVARLALMAYDEERPIEEYMETLRAALIVISAT